MTSSGQTVYSPNCITIISRAARLIRVIQEGESLSPNIAADFYVAINTKLKEWQATGIHVWEQREAVLFLQPNQARYLIGPGSPDHCCDANGFAQTITATGAASGATQINVSSTTGITSGFKIGVQLNGGSVQWTTVAGAPAGTTVGLAAALTDTVNQGALVFGYQTDLLRPLRVPQEGGARRRAWNSGPAANWIDTRMTVMSHLDYQQLPNKFTPGIPTQWFFQPTLGMAQMNVWPVSVDATSGVPFTYDRPIEIFNFNADTPDLPDEWISTLSYAVALEMAPEFDVPAQRIQTLLGIAQGKIEVLKSFDREPEPLLFQPDLTGY